MVSEFLEHLDHKNKLHEAEEKDESPESDSSKTHEQDLTHQKRSELVPSGGEDGE